MLIPPPFPHRIPVTGSCQGPQVAGAFGYLHPSGLRANLARRRLRGVLLPVPRLALRPFGPYPPRTCSVQSRDPAIQVRDTTTRTTIAPLFWPLVTAHAFYHSLLTDATTNVQVLTIFCCVVPLYALQVYRRQSVGCRVNWWSGDPSASYIRAALGLSKQLYNTRSCNCG